MSERNFEQFETFRFLTIIELSKFEGLYLVRKGLNLGSDGRYGFITCHRFLPLSANFEGLYLTR